MPTSSAKSPPALTELEQDLTCSRARVKPNPRRGFCYQEPFPDGNYLRFAPNAFAVLATAAA
jgi:hypothetical protein